MRQDSISKLRRRTVLGMATAVALPAMSMRQAKASGWPSKPVQIIVGYPAGSSPDMLARMVSEPLAKALGVPVIVDNRPGAGGNIGVDAVAKSSDGHTFGVAGNGPFTTAKALYPKLNYEPAADLRPISLIASCPFALVGVASAPSKNLKELISDLRVKGDKSSYGSIGMGSGSHLLMELLKSRTGLKSVHVPYRGSPAVVTSMLGGEIDVSFMVPSVALPHVRSGKLRMYGLSTASKSLLLPDYPSIAQEANIPEFDLEGWNAMFGPATLPEANARRVADELSRILRQPEMRQALFDQGWRAHPLAADGLASKISAESKTLVALIKALNITSE